MRLDRFLSSYSPVSRREVKKLLLRKAVLVNGELPSGPDQHLGENDQVTLNGIPVIRKEHVYLMLNKPQGYLSATEDNRDPVVTDLVSEEWRHRRLFPVGRLDKDTEGLLFLTDDGQFDHFLMSPRRAVVKRYYAELDRPAEKEDILLFRNGMDLGDFTTRAALLEIMEDPYKVCVSVTEGKFHQVRRMCEKVGKKVLFLKRISIGGVPLDPELPAGKIRELTGEEMSLLGFPDADSDITSEDQNADRP